MSSYSPNQSPNELPRRHSPAAREVISALPSLPKAELHLHMEGCLAPATVVELAARYGDTIDEATVVSRYRTNDFAGFIDSYKWVTSYLSKPNDYALAAQQLAEQLLAASVVYAEVTLSVGVMLLRKQNVAANFRAIREAVGPFEPRGLRLQWIFDTVRQFGPLAAEEVAQCAIDLRCDGVVAFGIGGDELSVPTNQFRSVYDRVAAHGLHRVAHAGEMGGPQSVREAVEELGAERIGHGIAAATDPAIMALLADRRIPLEICPTSNLRTGALARQLSVAAASHNPPAKTRQSASLENHPLPQLLRSGVPVTLSTDDSAMFETDLNSEFVVLGEMGLTGAEILHVAEAAFAHAFLPPAERARLLATFRDGTAALGLL